MPARSSAPHSAERFRDCLPLVRRVALGVAARLPSRIELSDLVQAGCVGLVDALAKFDEGKGVRFGTYAERRIRGSILDSLRELDGLPRSARRRRREIDAAVRRLESRLGRKPRDEELADELNLDADRLRPIVRELRALERRAELVEGFDGIDAFLCDPNAVDPQELLMRSQLRTLLARTVESLAERERLVITLYYHEELTMREIGQVLCVNESRVSQIHSRAVRTLRLRLRRHLTPRVPASPSPTHDSVST